MSDDDDEREAAAVAEGEVGDFGDWEEEDEEERATKCLFERRASVADRRLAACRRQVRLRSEGSAQ